jgi:hypothetical protein
MNNQEQESCAINRSFEKIVEEIYVNFIALHTQAVNDQERAITKATFQRQILSARAIRDLAMSLLPA